MSALFYNNPSKETLTEYFQELELCHREGFLSFSDMEYIKAAANRYLNEERSKNKDR